MMSDWLLFLLLGIPSWALVDGTWAILYRLTETLPEKYTLSAYLMLSLSLGNVFPIVLGSTVLVGATFQRLYIAILCVLITGLVGGIGLCLFWDISIGSTSWPFFLLFFIVGGCANLSNVTHFTFVSRWSPSCTTYLATGSGLGSLTSGLLAFTLSLNSTFSVSSYYFTVALFFLPALISVQFLYQSTMNWESKRPGECVNNNISYKLTGQQDDDGALANSSEIELNSEIATAASESEIEDAEDDRVVERVNSPLHDDDARHLKLNFDRRKGSDLSLVSSPTLTSAPSSTTPLSPSCSDFEFLRRHFPLLLIQSFAASMGYGVIPALLSTVGGRFRNSQDVLKYSTTIATVLDPIFRASTNYVLLSSIPEFIGLFAVMATISAIMITLSLLPAHSHIFVFDEFAAIPVVSYVLFSCAHVFCNTAMFRYFKRIIDPEHVQQSYRLVGVATQLGSFVGSSATFLALFS